MVDKKKKSTIRMVSRRDFLSAGKSAIVAGTVGACTIRATAEAQASRSAGAAAATTKAGRTGPWLPAKWDYEADVVVVGYGGAGACAAITAHDAGGKVIIMEKAPFRGGGNTSICLGQWVCPTNVQHAVEYLKAGCEDYTPLGEFGSIYGKTYSVTGGNVGEASAFGRIAGRNAGAMKRWT